MKLRLLSLLLLFLASSALTRVEAQCTAGFTWTNSGLNVTFTNTSVGGVNAYWDFGDGGIAYAYSPMHSYTGTGVYIVCLTMYTSTWVICDTYCDTISLLPAGGPCGPGFTYIVSGGTVDFTNTTSGTPFSYYWDFGDGSTSTDTNPSHSYWTSGWYYVCLYGYDSLGIPCGPSYCEYVYVPVGSAPCSAYYTFTVSGATVTFTNLTTGPPDSVWWDFGDGTTSGDFSPVHVFPAPGWYWVCMTPLDSMGIPCGSNYCEWVEVFSTAGCASNYSYVLTGTTADFTNLSTGPYASLWWDFGDGWTSTLANPTHVYSTAGSYYACLYTYDSLGYNCDAGFCQYITIPTSTSGCYTSYTYSTSASGDTLFFTNLSGGPAGSIGGYIWDFGDGTTSTLTNPIHVYTSSGYYYVCLTALDTAGLPCDYGYCFYIFVTTSCGPSFTVSMSAFTGVFTNTTSGATSSYYWDFGDGFSSSAMSPTHTYSVPGWYEVCMTAYDWYGWPCGTFCDTIYAGPVAPDCWSYWTFTSSGGTTINFSNASVGYTSSVIWSFGDGSTSTLSNPTHIYSAPGWYYVCIYANDSLGAPCDGGYCDWLFVDGCTSSFGFSTSGATATFFNTSFGAATASWDFGDGGTSTAWAPTHTYAAAGTYNVCLTTLDSAGGSCGVQCHNVSITGGTCDAEYMTYDSAGYTVFVSTSTTSSSVLSYSWSFGDGSTSIMSSPVHLYPAPATFIACLTIMTLDSCVSSTCDTIFTVIGRDNPFERAPDLTVWPNPSNGEVHFAYDLMKPGMNKLEIYDLLGQKIATVTDGSRDIGHQEFTWDAANIAKGIYIARLETKSGTSNVKIIRE